MLCLFSGRLEVNTIIVTRTSMKPNQGKSDTGADGHGQDHVTGTEDRDHVTSAQDHVNENGATEDETSLVKNFVGLHLFWAICFFSRNFAFAMPCCKVDCILISFCYELHLVLL